MENVKWEYFSAIMRFNELSLSQFVNYSILFDYIHLRYSHLIPCNRVIERRTRGIAEKFNFLCKSENIDFTFNVRPKIP